MGEKNKQAENIENEAVLESFPATTGHVSNKASLPLPWKLMHVPMNDSSSLSILCLLPKML